MIPAARHDEPSIISVVMEARMDPSTLPRAIALQFDTGEIVYPAGGQPVSRAYSYTGSGLRCFGKTTDFLDDPRYRRAHAHGWAGGGKKSVTSTTILGSCTWRCGRPARRHGCRAISWNAASIPE
jgi:hypothetical protein